MSAIISFLIELLRFFSELFTRRREEKANLWDEIQAVRNKLVLALEEGRITDVAIYRKQLDKLMKEYSKHVKGLEKRARSHKGLAPILLASVITAGCASWKSKPDQTVFVLGDRINLVKPGETVVIPELTSPAKQWYLVDNVGLQHWLGIVVNPEKKETAARADE